MESKPPPSESQMPETLSPCSSGRRSGCSDASPEFEFWMLRNPSFPQTHLLSADQLFSDGVLRPLHNLHSRPDPNHDPLFQLPGTEPTTTPNEDPSTPASESGSVPGPGRKLTSDDPTGDPLFQLPGTEPAETATSTRVSEPVPGPGPGSEPGSEPGRKLTSDVGDKSAGASKRWKDMFKKTEKKNPPVIAEEKKRERKSGGGISPAELNINIWPFSRSRSAGNGGIRPRVTAAAARKVSSAPCSRSNSAGESKSRKWPSSPSRGGVHLGRSSPVWQVRRAAAGVKSSDHLGPRSIEKGVQKDENEARRKKSPVAAAVAGGGDGGKPAKGLNLNVQSCIGYRQHLSCRSDESSAVSIAAVVGGGSGCQSGGVGGGDGGRGGNLFNIRNLFSKKVY